MSIKNQQSGVKGSTRFTELTEDEMSAVTGGTSNIYYDVSTGQYILRPAGSVYVGPGILVGQT